MRHKALLDEPSVQWSPHPSVTTKRAKRTTGRRQPDILIVGHISRDEIGFSKRVALGGTAAFAARAASAMGLTSCVVTAAPQSSTVLKTFGTNPLILLRRIDSLQETAFRLDYTSTGRRLILLSRATQLRRTHVPKVWRHPQCAYLAPLVGEVDKTLVTAISAPCIVLSAQGWLRRVTSDGQVVPFINNILYRLPPNITAVVFSEMDHPDAKLIAQQVVAQGIMVALTRGADSVILYESETCVTEIPTKSVQEHDPTGAGDVFGFILTLALSRGYTNRQAVNHAVAAAARVVEGPGLGNFELWVQELQRGACFFSEVDDSRGLPGCHKNARSPTHIHPNTTCLFRQDQ